MFSSQPLRTWGAEAEPIRDGRAIKSGSFGVMTHFAHGWSPDWVDVAHGVGITQVRDEVYWNQVETKKGVYEFPPQFDRYLAALKTNKITPLVVLSFENPLYDGGATPYTQEGFDGYARYAVEVLRRYGDQVKAVEIWNEYNGSFNHGPASNNRAETYLKMLRVTYTAIKRVRPDVTVVGGSTIGVPLPYWEKIIAGGGLNHMDALSVHPYRYEVPPEGLEDDIESLTRLVRGYNHGAAKPVWVTEIGWYLKPSKAPGDLEISESVQAKFLVRAYALLFSAGVEKVYWYLLRDYQDFAMGLVRDDAARTRKPAYSALSTMIQQLDGLSFDRRETTEADLYSLLFHRVDGKEVRIIWSLKPRLLPLSGAMGAVTIAGRPVTLGVSLALDDSPLFLTGPFRGLPPAAAQSEIVADSKRDFGGTSINGWSYGTQVGSSSDFVPLSTYRATDSKPEWTGDFPYVSVTATEQHPSATTLPVTAVRRWQSNFEGRVRIVGHFRGGTQGDGVGVSFAVDGKQRFRTALDKESGLVRAFDMVESVHPGTTFDFGVDPGRGTQIDYDVTSVTVLIQRQP